MEKLEKYIKDVTGTELQIKEYDKVSLERLPYYLRETYKFDGAFFLGKEIIILEAKHHENINVQQIEKQLQIIKDNFNKITILVINDIPSFTRKRLIEKGIDFIVPGKQMYLPDMLLNLNEQFKKLKVENKKLLPSAQLILLYHILHRYEKIEQLTLKQLAEKLEYSAMGITKAADNLKYHELCDIVGTKEKYIKFRDDILSLWHIALPLMESPVIKKVYSDNKPENIFLLSSNESALPEYTEMNPSRQKYFAIEKTKFYEIQKEGKLINPNSIEGTYCFEIWKYEPVKLIEGITETNNVDPLSLYLSLKNNTDERIEMGLEKIINDYIW